ncbi:hypothetical protein AB0301_14645 [Microbacterium profundi]|uniref:Uncharacterized protein n=1 Tax=Microbacterium profundi TaxID=450380 RepID=A0ABV3LK56_9MICO
MGTPTAVVVTAYIVTIATSTQWTSAFIGGAADRDVSLGRTPTSETPSLDELIRLYES